jgi:hypothetical protein
MTLKKDNEFILQRQQRYLTFQEKRKSKEIENIDFIFFLIFRSLEKYNLIRPDRCRQAYTCKLQV